MFVERLTIDDWTGALNHKEEILNPDLEAIEAAIRALDGERRTLVVLKGPGDHHLAVGGGGEGKFIVYMTSDNESFLTAINPAMQDASETILLCAGGQEGDFPVRQVIGVAESLAAARSFAVTGSPAESVTWQPS
jgi:hypothetical protein